MTSPVLAGTDVAAGTYRCTSCGFELDVGSSDPLPPCPKCSNPQYEAHGGEAACERKQLRKQNIEGQKNRQDRAERRAGRHAQDIGRHERIAEHALVGGASRGERGADEERGEHARPAHLQNDRLGTGGDRLP